MHYFSVDVLKINNGDIEKSNVPQRDGGSCLLYGAVDFCYLLNRKVACTRHVSKVLL